MTGTAIAYPNNKNPAIETATGSTTPTVLVVIGSASVVGCIGLTMIMNFQFGWGLGSTPAERWAMGCGAVVVDLAKVLAVWFLFERIARREWEQAALAGIAVILLVPVALMAAIGFVAETRGVVIGGKAIVAAGYAAAKDELEEMERRRARIASTRTPEQVGAAIEATRREPVRQGTRLRGTVEDISANCNRTDALTVEACRRITGLRQELADVEAGDRLDRQIGELRAKLEALRSQGGMQDTNVAASAVHHLVGRWVSLAQVLAGQNLLLPLAFEFWAMFGLVVVLDRRRRERPVVMVDDSAQTDAPAGAATEQTEMVATGRGAVAEFVRNGLEASEDSVMRRVELVDGYARWCAARRQVPVARAQFWEHFAGAGPAAGLKWSRRNGELVLSGVQLRSP